MTLPAIRSYRLTAPNAPDTPRLARDHVAYVLLGNRLLGLADTARLLVSEVVTNVYEHTATSVVAVETTIRPGQVLVAVHDASPRGIPLRRALPEGEEECGRGLSLVELLARSWGVTQLGYPEPVGKSVWFELRDA
ncbi:ATP-binding protein [Streptomyces xiamenensis]|uniref:ATP-binding protein n=1 Tax=Streptomyces xiamenensis TaxID=408015 RepID=UPI0035D93B1C